jgi:TetR/AcrR family transcriptional regulator, repressor for uid operon
VAAPSTSAELILAATRRAIAAKGPGKLTLSEVAAAAGVSRPTLYRWFPTKDDLFVALTQYERNQFDNGLQEEIEAHRSPARRLDAALRYLLTYLDESMGADPIGVDPAFALRSLNESLSAQVDTLVRLLGSALDQVPAVRTRAMSRAQAAEMFLRVAYSHFLVPNDDTEELLASMRAFAGLHRRSLARAVG